MAGLTMPMVAPRATPTPGQGVSPDDTDPTAAPAYAPSPAPAPVAQGGWQQSMYGANPQASVNRYGALPAAIAAQAAPVATGRGMSAPQAMTALRQLQVDRDAAAAAAPSPGPAMIPSARGRGMTPQAGQTLLDARAEAASAAAPAAAASALAPAVLAAMPATPAAQPQGQAFGPGGAAGKGLYAYDKVAGPTPEQASAIAQDQFRRYGMPLSGVADAMTGGGLQSPGAASQPALAAAGRTIPLAVAERLGTVMAQRQSLDAAQSRQAMMERYMTTANTKFQLASKAAGTDAAAIAKAEQEHQNAILAILSPSALAPSNIYGNSGS